METEGPPAPRAQVVEGVPGEEPGVARPPEGGKELGGAEDGGEEQGGQPGEGQAAYLVYTGKFEHYIAKIGLFKKINKFLNSCF